MLSSSRFKRFSGRRLIVLAFPVLLGACGSTSSLYGPAYVPQCTCCCGGGYTPYSYKGDNHSSIAGPPVATAFLHDTKGPLSDVSAHSPSLRQKTKGHAK